MTQPITTTTAPRLHVSVADAVATVQIDRPPANAFDPALITELLDALEPLTSDDDVRCVVVRGTGRFFVAGADIGVMRELTEETQRAMRPWIDVQRLLEQAPKPADNTVWHYLIGSYRLPPT